MQLFRLCRITGIVVSVYFVVIGFLPAEAAVFDCPSDGVTSDGVKCLVDAINKANATPNINNTINLTGTYSLTAINNATEGNNGLPSITSFIKIDGGITGAVIERSASAGSSFRIFRVATSGNLSLRNITLSNGFAFGSGLSGPDGGAILNRGVLHLVDSIVRDNLAAGAAGGIDNYGDMELDRSTIQGNANSANLGIGAGFNGGGIRTSGFLRVANSIIDSNTAHASGGGIYNTGQTYVLDSTISRNSAQVGGGMASNRELRLTNSTVSGNTNSEGNPGPAGISGSGIVVFNNTIVANNVRPIDLPPPFNVVVDNCNQPFVSGGTNLEDRNTCGFTGTSDLRNTNPGLGTFVDSVAAGKGHFPLLAGSLAIDHGANPHCNATDQLGNPRPADGNADGNRVCDIGAIEFYPTVNQLVTLDLVDTQFVPPGSGEGPILPYAPAGTFLVNPTFTNTSTMNICNVAFEVIELTPPNVMLDHRGMLVGGVGDILREPISGNVQHLLKGTTESAFSFNIGLGNRNRFQFLVNMLGDPTAGDCPP